MIEKKSIYTSAGYIYVLTNNLIPNIYKIGFTTRNPQDRANEINKNTGVPGKYQVLRKWWVQEAYKTERIIFENLSQFQIDKNELFLFEHESENEVIERIAKILKEIQPPSVTKTTSNKDNKTNEVDNAVTLSEKFITPSRNDYSNDEIIEDKSFLRPKASPSSIVPDVTNKEIRRKVDQMVEANYLKLEDKYNISSLFKKQLEREMYTKIKDIRTEFIKACKYTFGLMILYILLFSWGDGVNKVPMINGTIIFALFCILCFIYNDWLKINTLRRDLSTYHPEEIRTDIEKLKIISCHRKQNNYYNLYGLTVICRLSPPIRFEDNLAQKLSKPHRIDFHISSKNKNFNYERHISSSSEEEALYNFLIAFRDQEKIFKAKLESP